MSRNAKSRNVNPKKMTRNTRLPTNTSTFVPPSFFSPMNREATQYAFVPAMPSASGTLSQPMGSA